jgi:hypothetical protein
MVWVPSARLLKVTGLVQAAKGAWLSRHSKFTVGSEEENSKVASAPLWEACRRLTVVSGGVRSTVHV